MRTISQNNPNAVNERNYKETKKSRNIAGLFRQYEFRRFFLFHQNHFFSTREFAGFHFIEINSGTYAFV
ncbi:MAG: hypothetical protein DRZ79_05085 [Candidatus Cloacimonadota bacterium]|nr:MAG: hypothetical protein DRZ79_05085 [Candidatus Cloacimonadota bacterium]